MLSSESSFINYKDEAIVRNLYSKSIYESNVKLDGDAWAILNRLENLDPFILSKIIKLYFEKHYSTENKIIGTLDFLKVINKTQPLETVYEIFVELKQSSSWPFVKRYNLKNIVQQALANRGIDTQKKYLNHIFEYARGRELLDDKNTLNLSDLPGDLMQMIELYKAKHPNPKFKTDFAELETSNFPLNERDNQRGQS